MKSVLKGEKLSLEKEVLSSSCVIGINWDQSNCPKYEIDTSVMLLSERGKLEEEENFVFYNNLSSKDGSVKLNSSPTGNYKKTFAVDTKKAADDVSRIMFLLTIDNGDALNQRFGDVNNITVDIVNDTNQPVLQYKTDIFFKETAIILLEIYKRNNEWKIQAVGNGFNSGLDAILMQYGSEKVQLAADDKPSGGTPPVPQPQITEPAPAPPKPSTISLSKITLEKKGDATKIDLSKHEPEQSIIHINLNWNQSKKKAGFFRKAETIDLDLGGMFEMLDGGKGVIQALGNAFGSKYTYPFVFLDKDDRSGAATDGENLYIHRPDLLKRVAIFAFIYEGHSDFLDAGGVMTIKGLNQEITIKLDSPRPYLTFCVGAFIENVNGVIKIEKIDEYMKGHKECDEMFGFHFKWVVGSKD
jgi:tellurite resistance protein TerA